MILNVKKQFFLVLQVSLIVSITSAKNGRDNLEIVAFPFSSIVIAEKNIIVKVFKVPLVSSIGMIAGKPGKETLRIGTIKNNKMNYRVIPFSRFEPGGENGIYSNLSQRFFMVGNRIIRVVDMKDEKEIVTYYSKGSIFENQFGESWLIDEKKV